MLRLLAGHLVLFVFITAALAKPEEKPVPHWAGLLFKDAATIPGRIEKKLPNGPFSCGIITDARSFASLTVALRKGQGKVAPHWAEWQKSIDWKKEVVGYVILNLQTNRLTFQSCEPCKGGSTLTVRWSGIEPFYAESYPAVFARVPREEVRTLKFRVDEVELGEVPVAERKPE